MPPGSKRGKKKDKNVLPKNLKVSSRHTPKKVESKERRLSWLSAFFSVAFHVYVQKREAETVFFLPACDNDASCWWRGDEIF